MRNTITQKPTSSDQVWKSIPQFLALNLFIAFALNLIFCPSCFFSVQGLKVLIPHFIFSFLASSALSYGGYLVDYYFDARLSWIRYPVKRLVLTVLFYGVYSFIISLILVLGFLFLMGQVSLESIPWNRIISNTRMPMTIAFVIMAIFTTRSWLMEWRNAAIEAEQLKSENIASKYQSLKDQLNPHFLFNSLNVLSNLVYENADKSAAFIQQLSKIYRYVLDVQQEQLVSLDQELKFAENYLSLQKIRFEESLNYEIKVHKTEAFVIPPLSLQLLLENAIKHNIVSREKPLKILIEQKGEMLIVSNNLQPKPHDQSDGKGIGLDNIKIRYSLLSNKTIQILKTETAFVVELPLLQVSQS
jgi:sensor histidine kinase YesM